MEKFSQFRDRGSGIAPFLPVPTAPSGAYLPFYIFLALIRLPLIFTFAVSYFVILQWLPIGSLGKKAALWLIIGTPGIWWIDLQIDGVKRGAVASNASRLPHPGTVIASSFTSPLDALYLAAIFDPIFTASYPATRLVHRITLLQAILRSFSRPRQAPPRGVQLVELQTLLDRHPKRCVAVFPECTTTNGRGILPFSPSLLGAGPHTRIFPISLRYTAPDITTPIPGTYTTFLWNLLSKPTHCIRVRIAEAAFNNVRGATKGMVEPLDSGTEDEEDRENADGHDGVISKEDGLAVSEKQTLDKVGEALARLGRVKRVGLGVGDKIEFVQAWSRRRNM